MPDPLAGKGDAATFRRGMAPADIIAILLTVIWIGVVGGFLLFSDSTVPGSGGVAIALTLVAVILPVVLIWVAAVTARTARTLRDEAAHLQSSLDAMRQAYVAQSQAQAAILRDTSRVVPHLFT